MVCPILCERFYKCEGLIIQRVAFLVTNALPVQGCRPHIDAFIRSKDLMRNIHYQDQSHTITLLRGWCAPYSRGGGKLRSAIFRNFPQFRNFSQFSAIFRNFPQFSAIFPQFFTLPDFLTASPRWCRTMRIFFFYYSIHSQMLQSHQNLA
jgi:hypothetical protein